MNRHYGLPRDLSDQVHVTERHGVHNRAHGTSIKQYCHQPKNNGSPKQGRVTWLDFLVFFPLRQLKHGWFLSSENHMGYWIILCVCVCVCVCLIFRWKSCESSFWVFPTTIHLTKLVTMKSSPHHPTLSWWTSCMNFSIYPLYHLSAKRNITCIILSNTIISTIIFMPFGAICYNSRPIYYYLAHPQYMQENILFVTIP